MFSSPLQGFRASTPGWFIEKLSRAGIWTAPGTERRGRESRQHRTILRCRLAGSAWQESVPRPAPRILRAQRMKLKQRPGVSTEKGAFVDIAFLDRSVRHRLFDPVFLELAFLDMSSSKGADAAAGCGNDPTIDPVCDEKDQLSLTSNWGAMKNGRICFAKKPAWSSRHGVTRSHVAGRRDGSATPTIGPRSGASIVISSGRSLGSSRGAAVPERRELSPGRSRRSTRRLDVGPCSADVSTLAGSTPASADPAGP